MVPTSPEALEGRLVAHRKLLGMIVAELLSSPGGAELWDRLRERMVLQDNQEDPGAVPSEALAFELAVADEFNLLAEAVHQYAGIGTPTPVIGPDDA